MSNEEQKIITRQQEAILSEGLCPFCFGEVEYLDLDVWGCPNCLKGFEAIEVKDENDCFPELDEED